MTQGVANILPTPPHPQHPTPPPHTPLHPPALAGGLQAKSCFPWNGSGDKHRNLSDISVLQLLFLSWSVGMSASHSDSLDACLTGQGPQCGAKGASVPSDDQSLFDSLFMFGCLQQGLPRWLSGKESVCQADDAGSILGSGRSPGKAIGTPLQYSCLGNATDRGAW